MSAAYYAHQISLFRLQLAVQRAQLRTRSLLTGGDIYRTASGSLGSLWGARTSRNISRLLQNEIAPRHDTLEIFDHLLYHSLVFF